MRIALHIERLVVDAAVLGNERPAHVRAALEGELARLLAAPGAADTLRAVGAVDAISPTSLALTGPADASLGARVGARIGACLGLDATFEMHGGTRGA